MSGYRYNVLSIIIAGLAPYAGILFLGWTPEIVFLCYVLEGGVIGFFNIFKLLIVYFQGNQHDRDFGPAAMGWFAIIAFILTYGLLWFFQLGLFVILFAPVYQNGIWQGIQQFLPSKQFYLVFMLLMLPRLFDMVTGFIMPRAYRYRTLNQQIAEPFMHAVVIQGAVLISALIFLGMGSSLMILMVLTAVKVTAEVFLLRHNAAEFLGWQSDRFAGSKN